MMCFLCISLRVIDASSIDDGQGPRDKLPPDDFSHGWVDVIDVVSRKLGRAWRS
jgi:hypothetical protein